VLGGVATAVSGITAAAATAMLLVVVDTLYYRGGAAVAAGPGVPEGLGELMNSLGVGSLGSLGSWDLGDGRGGGGGGGVGGGWGGGGGGGWGRGWGQGLTLVHFSAQPEPFLTQKTPYNTPNIP
jgi:hypothetical protein